MVNPEISTLILAAGFGTRLGALGEHTPKGLIKVGDSSIIGDLVVKLPQGSPTALITNHHYFSQYRDWLNINAPQINLIDNGVETVDSRQGALKDLVFALDILSWWSRAVLVAPSDTVFKFSLVSFIVEAASHADGLTTIFRDFGNKDPIRHRLGCGEIDNGRLVRFVEKPAEPTTTLGAIPFYYYPSQALTLLKQYVQICTDRSEVDAPGRLIPWLLNQDYPVYAHIVTANTLDVGTPADLTLTPNFANQS